MPGQRWCIYWCRFGGRTAVFQIRIIEEERGTVSPDYIADNMDNHYNRSSNGQNLGNDFASSFQFVVPRIRIYLFVQYILR